MQIWNDINLNSLEKILKQTKCSPSYCVSSEANTFTKKTEPIMTKDNTISLTEIKNRVQGIRKSWNAKERLKRQLMGVARCEALQTILAIVETQDPRAA